MTALLEPPDSVRGLFVDAGWPVALRPVDPAVPADHPAAALLAQFGGLHVGTCDRGEDCASSDIEFGFSDDTQREPDVRTWERLLSTRLVNIAQVHHAHGALFVDDSGAWYGLSHIHDAFSFEGASFDEAVERILLGRRSKAMLRPDQSSVTLYGVKIAAGHPGAHDWRRRLSARTDR